MSTKLALAVLAAAGLFAIYSAPSFAASTRPNPPGGGTPTPGCTIDCGGGGGEIDTPGEPFNPPGGGDDGEEGGDEPKDEPKDDPTEPGDEPKDEPKDEPGDQAGNDPNYPGLTNGQIAELKVCLANLSNLPTVTET